jgi:DNA-binding CsgD family transcriptional regulator
VARWIDALPREAVLADARLCLARGWAALYLDLDECDRRRRAAEAAPLPDGNASVEEGAAILEAARANLSGDVGAAIAAARRALAEIGDAASPSRAIANVHLGMAAYYAGDLATAEAAFAGVLRRPAGEAWASVLVTALGNLAAVRLDAGDLAAAEQTAAETERVIGELGVHEAPFTCRAELARGKLLERRGDAAGARTAYERAVGLARRVDSHLVVAHGLLALAALDRRRGAHGNARGHAREARRVLSACRDPGVLGDLLARIDRSLQLAPPEARAAADAELSERELTILRLLASELSQREIGSELFISLNTVKAHTRSIFRKLGVSTRADAVTRGRELAGDALYGPASSASDFAVAKNATELVYTGAVSGALNKPSVLSAVLKDGGGKPLAGRTVAFQLGTQSASAVTDANGLATTSPKLTGEKGTYRSRRRSPRTQRTARTTTARARARSSSSASSSRSPAGAGGPRLPLRRGPAPGARARVPRWAWSSATTSSSPGRPAGSRWCSRTGSAATRTCGGTSRRRSRIGIGSSSSTTWAPAAPTSPRTTARSTRRSTATRPTCSRSAASLSCATSSSSATP